MVLNFPIQILWIISIGKQQERTWRRGVLLDTWLLFKKEIKHEKIRMVWSKSSRHDHLRVAQWGTCLVCVQDKLNRAELWRCRNVFLCRSRELEPKSKLAPLETMDD